MDRYRPSLSFYQRCTHEELKRFIRDRGLNMPEGGPHYQKCINRLRLADQKPSFPLMRLPPEMRNHIYRDVLLFPRAGARKPTTCFPAILRASRLINKEATGILYGENVIECVFTQINTQDEECHSIRIHDEKFPVACAHHPYNTIPGRMEDVHPQILKRIEQLSIRIYFTCWDELEDWQPGGYGLLNKCLLSLASFLMDDHKLKKVIIEFQSVTLDEEARLTLEDIGSILYPLRRLRGIKEVVVTGDLPKRMGKLLAKEMQSNKPAHNTIKHWKMLFAESHARVTLMQHLHRAECDCDTPNCQGPFPECMDELVSTHDAVAGYAQAQQGGGGIWDSYQEDNIKARLAGLQRQLRAADIAGLKEKVETFVKAESARRVYESRVEPKALIDAEKWWDEVDDLDSSLVVDREQMVRDDWEVYEYGSGDEEDMAT